MKKSLFLGLWLSVVWASVAPAQDLMSDTWVATDGVGRVMPTSADVGLPKGGHKRTVGIFYITWHTMNLQHEPVTADVTKVLAANDNARTDGSLWPQSVGSFFWGEPEYGYFLSQDPYVVRHDISMLTDAGVDVLILDVTNAVCYYDEWDSLFAVLRQMKDEGNPVPQFCFWAYNGPVITVVQSLYERYYRERHYSDLWFHWDGKPLLLCNLRPELDANGGGVKNPNPHYDAAASSDTLHPHFGDAYYSEPFYTDYTREVKEFFTLRNMWWGYYTWGGSRYAGTDDNWCFGYEMQDPSVSALTPLERAARHNGAVEQMAVTPAQHPISITGKSWRVATGEPPLGVGDLPDSAYVPWLGRSVAHPEEYGIYFQDRWDEALSVDPPFIYLNDWNEWTAGKYPIGKAPGSDAPGPTSFLGRTEGDFYFVDQYNAEFNRTIAPAKGTMGDNYYMQMVQNIRRYKGVRPIPVNKGYSRIRIDGRFDDWRDNGVNYLDTRGDTVHRDFLGYAGHHYTDNSGRNDIVRSLVRADRRNVYFYVETSAPLTPHTDACWMLLLIDADSDVSTGWEGFDYVVNYRVDSSTSTTLFCYTPDGWQQVALLPFAYSGTQLELSIPRVQLGLPGGAHSLSFDFKWADNCGMLPTPVVGASSEPAAADVLSVPVERFTRGDAAPNRRFRYRCIWQRR
ncbi:MAG: hypothetical protein J5698_07765 [Bacteroidaceae bacterium]|nr:hypothetical protein [Bacteroidaceae bacterium]